MVGEVGLLLIVERNEVATCANVWKFMKSTFTSMEAAMLFRYYTGFDFHPTVPGQLLARKRIYKLPTGSRPGEYHIEAWRLLWADMLELALRRCKYDQFLVAPKQCAIPNIDYLKQAKDDSLAGKTDSTLQPHPSRRFIAVPFGEKDEAKELGAMWDLDFEMWYIPRKLPREKFKWGDVLFPDFLLKSGLIDQLALRRELGENTISKRKSSRNEGGLSRLQRETKQRLDYLLLDIETDDERF